MLKYVQNEVIFMTEMVETKRPVISAFRVLGGLASVSGLVAYASATTIDINGTIGPILDSMITLIPTIISLIVAIVPAVLVMSVVAFIVTFFDRILAMIKL